MNNMLRFFPREEINGKGACPTPLYRWVLFSCRFFNIYLHHFVGEDWTIDPHNHPKNFLSIGLKGWYYEHVYGPNTGQFLRTEKFTAPWIRWFPARHTHRIQARNCWTLCIVGRPQQEWGFFYRPEDSPARWVKWDRYVKQFRERKSC